MKLSESTILAQIRKAFNIGPTRLFRNNQGSYEKDGYYIKYGLVNPGGSDLIGWHSIVITPEMVDAKIAVFSAIEVKVPGKKASPEQVAFINAVNNAGGIAGVATSPEDTEKIFFQYKISLTK